MSWFAGRDVEKIADDPNKLPDDTYLFKVTSAEHGASQNDAARMQITFKYQIIEGPWSSFFPLTDWAKTPENVDPGEVDRLLSHIKMRYRAFGFSDDEIGKLDPKKAKIAVGKTFWGTTKFNTRPDGSTSLRIVQYSPLNGNKARADLNDLVTPPVDV